MAALVRLLLRAYAISARIIKEPGLTLREVAAGKGNQFLRYASAATFLPRSQYRHRDLEWKPASTAHRKSADGQQPFTSRLGAKRELLCF